MLLFDKFCPFYWENNIFKPISLFWWQRRWPDGDLTNFSPLLENFEIPGNAGRVPLVKIVCAKEWGTGSFPLLHTISRKDQFFVILLTKCQPAKFAFLRHLLINLFCNEIPNLEAGEHVFIFVCKDIRILAKETT